MKMMNKTGQRILLLVLTMVLCSSSVLGLGLLPASQSVLLGKDVQEFSIFLVNDDSLDIDLGVRIDGSLAEFVEVDKETLFLSSSSAREEIKVKVKDIPSIITPGEHIVRIVVSDRGSGSGQISAKVSLSFRLTIIVPYDSAYLDVSLFAPNFDKTKGGNFVIQAQNKGSSNAVDVVPVIDIFSSTNYKIATLRGESRLIRSGEIVNFALPLSEDLQNGKYFAKASLVYSGKSNLDEKTFTVGSPEIIIDDISTATFRLGGIAGFDIFLLNNWGEALNVFAVVEFKKDDEVLEETTTATSMIEGMSRSRLQAYWDTSGLSAGVYDMLISLNYLDKKDVTSHQIRLEADKISVIGTGQVVHSREKADSLSLLVLVVFILVLLNVFLIYKFIIKKKEGNK